MIKFGHKETTEYFFTLMDAYYWNKLAGLDKRNVA